MSFLKYPIYLFFIVSNYFPINYLLHIYNVNRNISIYRVYAISTNYKMYWYNGMFSEITNIINYYIFICVVSFMNCVI